MARRGRQTEEEAALLKAQTAALAVQQRQAQQELEQKATLAREQMGLERELGAQKVDLGRAEISGRDAQSRREAALNALGLGQKEEAERSAARGDLLKRTDIPQDILARSLAESGDPTLYNAMAVDKAAKRDAAIGSLVPAMLKAKDDTERAKLSSALEATYPGIGKDAISKAFPKPGGFEKSAPETFKATNGVPSGSRFSALADELLGRGSKTAAPDPYAQPETRYVSLGSSPLEGSRLSGLDSQGRQGITTPSGGFIGGLTDRQIARFTGPADRAASVPAPAGAYDLVAPDVATASVNMNTLLSNSNENQPVSSGAPTPTQTGILTPAFEGGQSAASYLYGKLPQGVKDFVSGSNIPPEIHAQQRLEEEQRRKALVAAGY